MGVNVGNVDPAPLPPVDWKARETKRIPGAKEDVKDDGPPAEGGAPPESDTDRFLDIEQSMKRIMTEMQKDGLLKKGDMLNSDAEEQLAELRKLRQKGTQQSPPVGGGGGPAAKQVSAVGVQEQVSNAALAVEFTVASRRRREREQQPIKDNEQQSGPTRHDNDNQDMQA